MNALFIGLGGAGCSSVAEYARMVKNAGVKTNDAYLYFDTEVAMKDYYPIMGDDFMHLGSIQRGSRHTINKLREDAIRTKNNPYETELQKKESTQFLEWFDGSIRSGEPLDKGAEGVRMMSRTMLYAEYDEIKRIIRQKRTFTNAAGRNQDRRVYVVSGTCGGTGAGTVLDMLYLIQEVLVELQSGNANDPDTNLLLIMPQGYVMGVTDPNNNLYVPYRTNPYALFDEINGCMKDYNSYYSDGDSVTDGSGHIISIKAVSDQSAGKRYYYYRCCGNDTVAFPFTVCQNAYLFDSVDSNTGEVLSPRQRTANVSNFLYIMEAANQAQANLNTTVSNQSRLCKFASRNKPFIEAFSGSGIFIAQSWEELTRKYVHDKALYQLLKYGFLGDNGCYSEECVDGDKTSLIGKIDDIIIEFDYKTLLDSILQDLSGDDIEKLHRNIKNSIGDKSNRIKDIFAISNQKNNINELAKGVDGLLKKVRDYTYESCTKWMMDYNLYHALKVATDLDGYFDNQYRDLLNTIAVDAMDIDWYVKIKRQGDKKRREICTTLLSVYIKYLVYRNLSNEDNGYLDNCKKKINAAIDAIDFNQLKIEGVKVCELRSEYIKYLTELKNDLNRRIYPSLNTLFNFDTTSFVANNFVESKYMELIAQSANGLPDFRKTGKDENNNELQNLLYQHKASCIENMKHNETSWSNYFEMNDSINADTFAENIKLAFSSFVKEAKRKAESISLDSSLSKPFPQLNPDEQANLIETMQSYQSINLSVNYSRANNAHTSIVVGDLVNNLSWLKAGLFPQNNSQAAYNTMEKVEVQSTDMPDRVVLLFVRFGYALNDYSYYDIYKDKFEYIVKHPKERVNPMYNDRRFWEAKGNIGEFFRSIKEQAEKNSLVALWKGHYDILTKFNSLFLYKLLDEHYSTDDRTGLDILDKIRRNDFIKLEKKKATASKTKTKKTGTSNEIAKFKEIVFYKTEDHRFATDKAVYNPEKEGLVVEFGKKYDRITNLRSSVPYFEFWLDVLRQLGEALDQQLVVQAFNDTKSLIGDYNNDARQFVEEHIYNKYHKTDLQTNAESVDWYSCFADYIRICRK